MAAVEEKVRAAGSAAPKHVESSFTVKLRERVAELEEKLAKAQAAGRPTADLEQQLATQREWLASAGGAASSGGQQGGGSRKKPTTAWVRADS